jgi:hypothetical protein
MTRILLSLLLALTCYAPTPLFLLQNGASAAASVPAPLRLSVAALQYLRTPPAGAIASWTDESGNGNHATQGTTAKQPQGISAAYNGKNCARFDATDDSMDHTSVNSKACWMVIKGSVWNSTVAYVSGGNARGYFPDINAFSAGPGGFDSSNLRVANSTNRIATGSLVSLLITSTKVFVNGVEVTGYRDTGTVGTVAVTRLNSRTDIDNYRSALDLVEIAHFDGTPSASDVTALATWARDEYGTP